MKIITICGSMRFWDDMAGHHRRLALEGNLVIELVPPAALGAMETPEQIERIAAEHYKKIDLCDAVFIVNKGGYIGESTKREIEYARVKGKEVIFGYGE